MLPVDRMSIRWPYLDLTQSLPRSPYCQCQLHNTAKVIPHLLLCVCRWHSPHILLSYATSEQLGILEFKVPNLAAHLHIDALAIPTFSTLGSSSKTAKSINFDNPLIDLDQSHHTLPHSSLRKTAKAVHFSYPMRSTINGTKCKEPPPLQQLPLPARKACIAQAPATTPKPNLKP